MNRGNIYAEKKEYDRAAADYDQAIQANPKYAQAYYRRGIVWSNKKDYVRAVKDYDQAINLDPKYAEAHVGRGRILIERADYDRALADFDQAIAINPKYTFAYLQRGYAWFNKKDYARAIQAYDEAISIDPAYADAYIGRGRSFHHSNKLDRAIEDYNKAIVINPKMAVAYNNRGVVQRAKGNIDKAVADYAEAIRLDPNYSAAYTNRGQAHEAAGHLPQARADYAAAAALPSLSYDNSKWAFDTAKARLAVLGTPTQTTAVAPPPKPNLNTNASLSSKPAPVQATSRRVALVVGNSNYKGKPLANPANDARAMAATLRQIGFQVIDGYDLDYAGMRRTISDFLLKVSNAQVAVVYYAGHGIQLDGRNYLVPTDAKLVDKRTAGLEMFDMEQILSPLDDPGRANIVFLDACRNDPFASQTATTRGFDTSVGTLGLYECVGGHVHRLCDGAGQSRRGRDRSAQPVHDGALEAFADTEDRAARHVPARSHGCHRRD